MNYLNLIFAVIFTLNSTVVISQRLIVDYVYHLDPKPIDLTEDKYKNLPENVKSQIVKNSMIQYKDYFTLKYEKGKSEYIFKERKFETDNLDFKPRGYNLNFYTDYSNKKVIMIADWIPKEYQVERNLNEVVIKLEKETKVIKKFKCKKAIVTFLDDRKATVWYTEEIPIMAGPSWFSGLPGLVLRVEFSDSSVIEALNINFPEKSLNIMIPNRKQSITYSEYRKSKVMEWMSNAD